MSNSVRRGGAEVLDLVGSTPGVGAANTGRLFYDVGTQKFQVSLNGAAAVDVATGVTGISIGSAIGSSTPGSIFYAGISSNLAQNNAHFFWDFTNSRLGIGTNAPAIALDIARGTAEAGIQLRIGTTLPVSAASTGRLRYNATTHKFQASLNTAAYLDLALNAATLVTGSILFADSSGNHAQDSTNLFWDNTNKRLGLGTASPTVALNIATGTTQAAIQFHIGDTVAVSAASTGRLRYTTTGQKFQVSKNAAAYEDVATLATAQTWTKSQNVARVALSDAANIATDASLGNIFSVTLGGNRTLDNPTNLVDGGTYSWIVTQDGTGSRTLAYGALFKWPGGTVPVLSTAIGAVDLITAIYNGTILAASINKAFA